MGIRRVQYLFVALALWAASLGGMMAPDTAYAEAKPSNTPVSSPRAQPSTTGETPNSHSNGSPPSPYQSPAPNPTNDLDFHTGGLVMLNPIVYNVFWLPAGQHYEAAGTAASDTSYESLLNRFFGDLGGSDYENLVTQYAGANGTPSKTVTFGGSRVDTTAYPHAGTTGDPLLDNDVQAAATRAATAFGVTPDINHIFMVYTGINVFECQANTNPTTTGQCNFFTATGPGSSNAYCAYHSSFNSGNSIYAFMGSDGMGGCSNGVAPNGDAEADAETSTAAHEFIESVTDPRVNTNPAWYDDSTGKEIGDLCNRNDGPRNSINADVYLGAAPNPYDIQQQWSNAVHGCAMDLNAARNSVVPPNVTIQKSGPASAVSGQTLNYTITVRNLSNTDASTLTTVTDTLPAGVTYLGGSSSPAPTSTSPLTWDLATIAVHDTATITFQAKAGGPGAINNCASVTFDDMLQIASHSAGPGCASSSVSKASTTTSVSSSANPSVYGQPVTLTATVSPVAPGTGTETGTVSFYDSGALLASRPLSSGGQVTFTTSAFSAGTHPITATYGGDGNFNGSSSPVYNQVVNKAATTTIVTASPASSATFGTNVTFTATVAATPPGAGTPTGTVQFSVDGNPVTFGVLNGAGQAIFSTTSLGAGSHTISATYFGDGNFLTSSGSVPYTITCGTVITGSRSSSLTITGSTCLLNASIGGSVTLSAGASVDVEGSTIHGNFTATSTPGTVRLCATSVHGSAKVSDAAGFVLLGDPGDDACGVDTFGGNATLAGNHAGVEIVRASVSGSVMLSNDAAGGPYPDDIAIEVEGNRVDGSLLCTGNTPSVVNDGQPNRVAGSRTGQCATL